MTKNELIRILSEMQVNRCTPEIITSLKPGEVFVFGSKPDGCHKSGAAMIALERFGAIEGKGEGVAGQSYAIPVHRHQTEKMALAVSVFIDYARSHPSQTFFVLPIGCGSAGMNVEVVANMFKTAIGLDNLYLPEMFIKAIKRSIVIPEDEPLPIKYVDETIGADRLRGRMFGLMVQISKRTERPITFNDEILKKDKIFLFAFLRIAKVVTKEEQRVMNVLLDEAKRMSESGIGQESDNGTIRALELVQGWKLEANKIFEDGGSIYDLLIFTNPEYIKNTHNIQSTMGYHGKLETTNKMQRFEEDGKFGLKTQDGVVIIPAEYDKIETAGWVGRGWHLKKGQKWGAVNERGEWIFDVKYDKIKTRYEGGHFLTKCGKMGFCDSNGVLSIDFLYDELENYSSSWEGAKAKIDGKWGYVDENGKVVVPILFDYVSLGYAGMILVKKDNKYGYYNITANVTIPIEYDFAYDFTSSHSCETVVKKNEKWGIINTKGDIVLPLEYEDVSIDTPNVYRVKKNGRYGIINKEGVVLFPFKYFDLGPFDEDGITYAMSDCYLYGYIDRDDNVIIEFSYKKARGFDGKYAEVSMGWNQTGLIDRTGRIVVPMKYAHVHVHWDGTAEVEIDDRDNYRFLRGMYDLNNNNSIPCVYERIEPLGRNESGIMECRCWKTRDTEPVILKVDSKGTNRAIRLTMKEAYYIKLNILENGKFEIADIRKNKNDSGNFWIEAECVNQVLTLPKTVGGKEIIGLTSFGCWTDRSPIKGLIVPEGYKYIGGEAFMSHPTLEFVSLPDGLRKIEQAAFMHCSNLKHVFLGGGFNLFFVRHPLSIIENLAFDECHHSLTFYIPDRFVGRTYDQNRFKRIDSRERNETKIISEYMRKCSVANIDNWGRIAVARDFAITLNENEWELNLIGYNPDFRQLCRTVRRRFVKLAAGFDGYMALTDDGSVIAGPPAREFNCRIELERLHNVIDLVGSEGHTVALHNDGTVTCIDEPGSYEGPERFADKVSCWNDIVQVACGFEFVAGLKSDGTLISVGSYYRCPNWQGVVQFDAFNCYYGQMFTIALLSDGKVVSDYTDEVAQWRNVIRVRVGEHGRAVGLKSDGTAYALGNEDFVNEVQSWRNIVDIECKFHKAVAILSDGTILTSGFY